MSSLKQKKTGDNILLEILNSHPGEFEQVLQNAQKHRLQILYTMIDRDADNRPVFRSYNYGLNTKEYFYPASTVKLAAAVLALEKLNNLHIPGLDKYTPLKIDSAYSGQTTVVTDSTAGNYLPSVAHYIKKIFLVSDNDAYNRLYEFLGQQYINETLWAKGYEDVKIIRRLESGMSPEENRATNPFTFYRGDEIIYQQPLVVNPVSYKVEMAQVRQGIGYFSNGKLIHESIDFSQSNHISIACLQNILKAVIFPEAIPERMRFNLTDDDYRFLYRYMSMLPRESDIVQYHNDDYYDSYSKFFIFGNSREPIPSHIRLFSKSGLAYGYLLDNAYIVDFENKIEFLLTAVLQVNENQIYNDDTYEYDETGIPFLTNLGRRIYEYELARQREFQPDLSGFGINLHRAEPEAH